MSFFFWDVWIHSQQYESKAVESNPPQIDDGQTVIIPVIVTATAEKNSEKIQRILLHFAKSGLDY